MRFLFSSIFSVSDIIISNAFDLVSDKALTFVQSPKSIKVMKSEDAGFYCYIMGSHPIHIEWKKKEGFLPNSSRIKVITEESSKGNSNLVRV